MAAFAREIVVLFVVFAILKVETFERKPFYSDDLPSSTDDEVLTPGELNGYSEIDNIEASLPVQPEGRAVYFVFLTRISVRHTRLLRCHLLKERKT